MASGLAQQQSRLKKLIALGREQGYLTYAEVNDHLPDDISDPEQIEDIISMINDMGILVQESAPESDDLMAEGDSTDELAAEEAAAVLVAVENETGRTTDPVRMYMREMGTVDLLTREGEIEIAKRIEEGIRDVLEAAAGMPGVVGRTLEAYAATQEEEGKRESWSSGPFCPHCARWAGLRGSMRMEVVLGSATGHPPTPTPHNVSLIPGLAAPTPGECAHWHCLRGWGAGPGPASPHHNRGWRPAPSRGRGR